jgi:hypothetical protein
VVLELTGKQGMVEEKVLETVEGCKEGERLKEGC